MGFINIDISYMTKYNRFNDASSDRSDVKQILETIETMYDTCQNVLNTYTQSSLLFGIIIESQMLLMKLQVMKDRWSYHLPFKEACTVDFYDWSKKIKQMSLSIVGPDETGESYAMLSEYCPSKHFMLDLYTMLPENSVSDEASDYYRELDVFKIISSQDRIKKAITKKWPDYKIKISQLVAQKVNLRTDKALIPLTACDVNIRMICHEVLLELSAILYELFDMPKGIIPCEQFARLAERVLNENAYGGRKAQQSARRYIDNLKNTTPEGEWEKRRDEEINASIVFINELKYGRKVFTFLGHSYDIKDHYGGLGKFLNSVRREIGAEELSLIIEHLFRIHYFLEDKNHLPASSATGRGPDKTVTVNGKPSTVNSKLPTLSPQTSALRHLPDFFIHDLRVNPDATAELIRRVTAAGIFMGRNLTKEEKNLPEARPYVKWKWNHLLQAFKDMELIDSNTTQTDFANFLVQVLPDRKVGNILQSIYRNCDKMNSSTLADVKDEFMPVKNMLKKSFEN